jgi:hypothetical protein
MHRYRFPVVYRDGKHADYFLEYDVDYLARHGQRGAGIGFVAADCANLSGYGM